MGNFKKFGEYLNKKTKKDQIINAKDGLAGEDYDGPLATKPPQLPTKGKNDKPLPYKGGGEEVDKDVVYVANDTDEKKGFAYHSTPGITPQTSSLGKSVDSKTKQVAKQKKLTSEQFIATTKNMSDADFVNYISEAHDTTELPTVTDLFGHEFTPDPTQTFQYVASLMSANPTYISKFVRELKRRDGLEGLMSEVFDHSETYDHIIDHLEHEESGPDRCAKMSRMMNERHMKAFEDFDFGDDEDSFGESVSQPIDAIMGGKSKSKEELGGSFGGGSKNAPDPNYAKSSPARGGATGGGYPGGKEEGGGPDVSFGGETNGAGSSAAAGAGSGQALGGQKNPQFTDKQPLMPPKKMKEGGGPKYKGKSAAHNMINELSGFPHFKKHMIERCTGPNC